MTTDADTSDQIDAAEVWRAIGRLESDNAALLEGQREIKAGLEATNRRADRIFYAIFAVGGALPVAVLANRIIGG